MCTDFNGVVIVQNYLQRAGRDTWMQEVWSTTSRFEFDFVLGS